MNQELFELCKEVFDRTGWGNNPEAQDWTDDEWEEDPTPHKYRRTHMLSGRVPYYTSDYLLEKLPESIGDIGYDLMVMKTDRGFHCGYVEDSIDDLLWWKIFAVSDTPLKALLKLTLALHEAGELK